MRYYIEILAALLTPTIAVITTYIAVRQYRSNRLKQRLELYDRRLAVYNATMKFIRIAAYHNKIEDKDVDEFLVATEAATFLFGRDVNNYLTTVYARATHLQSLRNVNPHDIPIEMAKKRMRDMNERQDWLSDQQAEELGSKVFLKYLSLNRLR